MKERLDVLLVKKDIFQSREQAKTAIMEGNIFVNGNREDKAGMKFNEDSEIEFRGKVQKYVSRGGHKLEKAMNSFPIDLNGLICMDIGASTGGFTDCMLQNGAKKVYAVDVGYGQFAWKLRTDERVVCMEKTNIRYVTEEDIKDKIDFASCDVSFISLTKILAPVRKLLSDNAEMVCLIKPQFEAGRENVGKHGVVRETSVQRDVINMIQSFVLSHGYDILGLDYSPIKGPEGNIEFLIHIRKNQDEVSDENINKASDVDTKKETSVDAVDIEESVGIIGGVDADAVVTAAHAALDK